MSETAEYRRFLRADRWEEWEGLETDQRKQLPPPPPQKPPPAKATLIDLVAPGELAVGQMPLVEAIGQRRSRRQFTPDPLTLEELSFLLWATQGLSGSQPGAANLRTVPSAGARHPFETYLQVDRVEGVEPGLYRYLALDHKLCLLHSYEERRALIQAAWGDHRTLWGSAVVFFWTAIPYRTEWRYSIIAPKLIALDAGHVCQNLYLACEAIGAGTCAIAAYNQRQMDALLGVDVEDELVVYLAPVGKVAQ
jgi:SagB-type dehydrogenase family enzyme